MSEPWLQDACSLVEAFRAREISPVEAVRAVLDATEASDLGAVCHVDPSAWATSTSRAWATPAG